MSTVHPDDRALAEGGWRESAAAGIDLNVEVRLRSADGGWRWTNLRAAPIRHADGGIAKWVGMSIDISDRKQAEESLHRSLVERDAVRRQLVRSNQRLSEILESIQDDFYVLDREWRFIFISRSFTARIGKKPEDLLGLNIWEAFPKHVGTSFEEHFRAVMDGRETRRFEVVGQYTDAIYRMTAFPSPEGVTVWGSDITQRRRDEEALRESQAVLQAFYDSSPLMMGTVELDGDAIIAVYANAAVATFFGRSSEAMATRKASELGSLPSVDRLWVESYRQSQRESSPVRFEYQHPREGRVAWISATVCFLGLASSGRPRFSFVAEEVTERKQADEAVRRSERLLRDVIDGSPNLIVSLKDRDGRYLALNSYLERLLGKTQDELKGKTDYHVFPAEQSDYLASHDRQVLDTGKAILIEEEVDLPDGHFTFLASKFPLRDSAGAIYGVGAVAHDITERKRMQRELEDARQGLERADRYKNEFLAVLSHELRNPLTAVKNSLYILQRVTPGGEQALRARGVIERQVDQLSRLVDDLLDVTRISRGKVQLQRRRFELNELVRHTLEDHRGLFDAAGLHVRLDSSPQELFIYADRNRVAQVLGNLLHNAVKFTPAGGEVRIVVASDARTRQALVRVSDTGAGFPPELRDRLFEPFMQADETLDRSKGGLGLGLALVKALVELHGGSVKAESAGVGKGADFAVRLPLDISVRSTGERDAIVGHAGHRRVLVIEDNQDAATTLREALELCGHTVAVAFSGPEGLSTAHAFLPDVVLCDIGLPGMDGFAVARAFRADERLVGVRLIAVSGYALPEDLQRAAEAGFERHLAKPASLEKLEEVIGNRDL